MGLLRMAARTAVVAGTATAVSGNVQRRQASRHAGDGQPQQAPAPVAAEAPADDPMQQLQDLAALHTQGVLSDDEFAAAKAKILGI